MIIKRLLPFVTIIALSFTLSSCSSYRSEVLFKDYDKISDMRFQNIATALENKDKEKLKNMFSPGVLKEAKDIDSNIEYLMNFFKGEIKSKEGSNNVSGSNDYGEKTSELNCMYIVTTDVDKYLVFFVDELEDTKNPDNVGLYMLQIIKESDREKQFDWGGEKTRCAGIYHPDNAESKGTK
ncbi:hypothetical protein CLHUN_42510 [Ruminiclostridium hungatei]|uniref:DUF5104 domain-containing protein n=1 Tax=Ruminiclostridium hungatei TaxID=48256 RepID=A0A1V4SDH3_RUMHU|nr:DUF5104 domain-containing protein [Ruminiclostridium hungatei]OPX41874.1 hypothetical protein CLHUN_42510 [Ruminiclostridium hungatei]